MSARRKMYQSFLSSLNENELKVFELNDVKHTEKKLNETSSLGEAETHRLLPDPDLLGQRIESNDKQKSSKKKINIYIP